MSRARLSSKFTAQAMGCAVGDYDNDGKPDLAVTINGGVLLFHNEGNGTFKDVTEAAGLKTDPQSDVLALGVTFIDYDHDGDLDLYVTRFNAFPLENPAQHFRIPNRRAAARQRPLAQQWQRHVH